MAEPRGMHKAILRHMARGTCFDLRRCSEPTRQRLIDLAMHEPPLVDIDADGDAARVKITEAGRRLAAEIERDK